MNEKEMEIEVEMVPLSGKSQTKKYVMPIGSTVGEIASKHDIDLTNRNVSINKMPVTMGTVVKPNERLEVIQIRVAERPQGS